MPAVTNVYRATRDLFLAQRVCEARKSADGNHIRTRAIKTWSTGFATFTVDATGVLSSEQ